MFLIFLIVINFLIITAIFISLIKSVIILLLSYLENAKSKKLKFNPEFSPKTSILVPCYNEEKTLGNCIESLLSQNYPDYEIVIINDGSTDNTDKVAKGYALKNQKVRYLEKENGGKAKALNHGIKHAKGEIIISIDADSVFLPNTVRKLTRNFIHPKIGAVGGNVKVGNRNKALCKNQSLEYISGIQLEKRAFNYLGCNQIVPGPVGAFRKKVLEEIGGYSTDTIIEDMDLTVAISLAGHLVHFENDAIAYTESPENLKSLFRQRYRWSFGYLQILAKYKNILFKRRGGKNGRLGLIGLPYFLFSISFQIFSLVLLFAIFGLILFTNNLNALFFFYGSIFLTGSFLSFYTILLDKEEKSHLLRVFSHYIWYYHFLTIVMIIALYAFLKKKGIKWHKLERTGVSLINLRLKRAY
jgi:peptidoglycan-N-acetylglucosamine deacetylase